MRKIEEPRLDLLEFKNTDDDISNDPIYYDISDYHVHLRLLKDFFQCSADITHVHHLDTAFHYDRESESYVLCLMTDASIETMKDINPEKAAIVSAQSQRVITNFLNLLAGCFSNDDFDIYPEDGEIHFDNIIDIFKALETYLFQYQNISIENIESISGLLGDVSGDDLPIDPKDAIKESVSRLFQKSVNFPAVANNILYNIPIKNFSSYAEAFAYGYEANKINNTKVHAYIEQLMLITKQSIHHAEQLGIMRNPDLTPNHEPLIYSCN